MRPVAVRAARRSYKVAARTRQRLRSSAKDIAPSMSASTAAMRSSGVLGDGATGLGGSTASKARAGPRGARAMGARRGAMLDGQGQVIAIAAQIEV
jgi:hypothetical protein